MKKKALAVVATAAALALSVSMLAGCSSEKKEEAPAPAAPESTKLVVGFDSAYPPYGYVADDGSYTGFDLELAREVAARNGWEIEEVAIDWDAKDSLVESGQITCIWNGFTYEGREDAYAWTEPYMNNSQVILVKADSTIDSTDALAGKAVVTQADSAALTLLEGEDYANVNATFKDGGVATISDYTNALLQLESGAVDAVACDASIADYAMAQNPGVYKVAFTLSEEHYAVGFKLDNQAMADAVTATLKEMVADGFVANLMAEYAAEGINADNWCLSAE